MRLMDWKKLIADLKIAGFSQEQIAQACGCGQTTISELMTGKTKNPGYSVGEAIKSFHRKNAHKIRAAA